MLHYICQDQIRKAKKKTGQKNIQKAVKVVMDSAQAVLFAGQARSTLIMSTWGTTPLLSGKQSSNACTVCQQFFSARMWHQIKLLSMLVSTTQWLGGVAMADSCNSTTEGKVRY
jgi:hypothetical protein